MVPLVSLVTHPASLSTLKCCDTLDWASGSALTIFPQMHRQSGGLLASILTISTRAGCDNPLASSASFSLHSLPDMVLIFSSSAGQGLSVFLLRAIVVTLKRRFVRNDITGEYHILHSAAEVPAPYHLNVIVFLRDTDMLEPLGSQDASHRIR